MFKKSKNTESVEELTEKQKADKLLLNVEIVFGCILLGLWLLTYFFAIYVIEMFNIVVVPTIVMIVSTVIFIGACCICVLIEQKAGFYKCKHCGHKHIPEYKKVLWCMHYGRTRYMQCPQCKQKSWQKKVIK